MRLVFLVAVIGLSACGGDSAATDERLTTILDLTGDEANGADVYSSNCAVCHGASGEGISGPSMSSVQGLSDEQIVDTILNGIDSMPAFDNLPDQDIADLLEHVRTY